MHVRTHTHTPIPTHPPTHPPTRQEFPYTWQAQIPFFFSPGLVCSGGDNQHSIRNWENTHTHTYAYCRYIDIVHCQICSSHVSQVEVRIGMTLFFSLVQSTEFLNVRRWEPLRPETRVAVPWLGWDTPGSTPYPPLRILHILTHLCNSELLLFVACLEVHLARLCSVLGKKRAAKKKLGLWA